MSLLRHQYRLLLSNCCVLHQKHSPAGSLLLDPSAELKENGLLPQTFFCWQREKSSSFLLFFLLNEERWGHQMPRSIVSVWQGTDLSLPLIPVSAFFFLVMVGWEIQLWPLDADSHDESLQKQNSQEGKEEDVRERKRSHRKRSDIKGEIVSDFQRSMSETEKQEERRERKGCSLSSMMFSCCFLRTSFFFACHFLFYSFLSFLHVYWHLFFDSLSLSFLTSQVTSLYWSMPFYWNPFYSNREPEDGEGCIEFFAEME